MKNYLLLLLLVSISLFAQEKDFSTPLVISHVEKMAVFPGCEEYEDAGKKELIKCFASRLGKEIVKFLDTEFPTIYEPKKKLIAKLEFIANTDGYLDEYTFHSGDIEFRDQAIEAIEKTSNYLKEKGLKIKPALLGNGNEVSIIFHQTLGLQNPSYDDSDWVIYYHIKGFAPEEILQKMEEEQGITDFTLKDVRKKLKKYRGYYKY